MLKLGTQNISALYVGGAKIKRALVGTEVVYEAVRPPAVYTISAVVAPASGGSVTGAGQYQEGETVTLTYTPAEDHRFTGWYAGSTLLSQANPYTFAAAQDIAVTAKCEEIPTYTLTLAPTGISAQNWSFSIAVNGSGVTWSGSGAAASSPAPQRAVVKEGSVTVQATSPDGYEFTGWQVGSGGVVTSNPYTFTVTGDTTLYCRYAKKSRLPAGYTEVEWIAPSSTTSRLTTNLWICTTSSDQIIEADFEITSAPTSTSKYYLMCAVGSSAYAQIWVTKSGIYANFSSSSSTATLLTSDVSPRRIHIKIDVRNKKIYLNNVATSINSIVLVQVSSSGASIGGSSSSYYTFASMRFYGLKGTCSTHTSASYFPEYVPCKNPSGTLGVYNLTNSKFYSVANAWTAGPAV